MDNRRLGVISALTGAALAVASVALMVVASDISGFPVEAWAGIPIVGSFMLLVMSLAFLSGSGKRQN